MELQTLVAVGLAVAFLAEGIRRYRSVRRSRRVAKMLARLGGPVVASPERGSVTITIRRRLR